MVASWSFAAVAYIESDILGPGSHRGFLQGDSAVMVRPKMTPLCQTASRGLLDAVGVRLTLPNHPVRQ